MLIALRAYAVPASSALSHAVVLHLVNFVPFILVGLYLLHHNSRHPRHADPTDIALGVEVARVV